jgi:hypothetical protein
MRSLPCRLCGATAEEQFTAQVLHRHDAAYFLCPACDLLQTEDPHWLAEAYTNPIPAMDSGYVLRNHYCAALAASVIERHFDPKAAFVDYGGGYGMLVAAMRSMDYDFLWTDKYCANLFAPAHIYRPGESAELVTCFETFEHFVQPAQEIERILGISRTILFSTTLRPERVPGTDWHYYAFEGGQHVALYSLDTLKFVAGRYGLNFYSDGVMMHLCTTRQLENFTTDSQPGLDRWLSIARAVFDHGQGIVEFHPE